MTFWAWRASPAVIDCTKAWAMVGTETRWQEVDAAIVQVEGIPFGSHEFTEIFGDLPLPSAEAAAAAA